MTNRDDFLELWDGCQTSGLWCASWPEALGGVTAAEAAWQPAPGRHSIWQNVNHVRYWRLFAVDRACGRPRPAEEEIQRQNFAAPQSTDEAAWQACVAALHESHATVRAAAADEATDFTHFKGIIAHDHYHLGQIMLLRAMQGKPPVE
jgi:hypothetical protein